METTMQRAAHADPGGMYMLWVNNIYLHRT